MFCPQRPKNISQTKQQNFTKKKRCKENSWCFFEHLEGNYDNYVKKRLLSKSGKIVSRKFFSKTFFFQKWSSEQVKSNFDNFTENFPLKIWRTIILKWKSNQRWMQLRICYPKVSTQSTKSFCPISKRKNDNLLKKVHQNSKKEVPLFESNADLVKFPEKVSLKLHDQFNQNPTKNHKQIKTFRKFFLESSAGQKKQFARRLCSSSGELVRFCTSLKVFLWTLKKHFSETWQKVSVQKLNVIH